MHLKERIETFAELGGIIRKIISSGASDHGLLNLADTRHIQNPWFTPSNVRTALAAVAEELTYENLSAWTARYPELQKYADPVNVGVIMAGNIPLVGFHDFLSVLISGNRLIAKCSSRDHELIVKISEILCKINPRFAGRMVFTEGQLKDFEMVIATGSNNSSRYFEYYFGKYPHIIRKNRNSIAVIDGTESQSELKGLGTDIFLYFGLGCRNVSKIFIPQGYEADALFSAWDEYSGLINHSKYANNYDFSKAVYLVNKEKFIDGGFILLKEDKALSSPVAVLYYEHYDSSEKLQHEISDLQSKIQCVTGHGFIPFGKAQSPHLWDYADGTDTLQFLLKKNHAGIM